MADPDSTTLNLYNTTFQRWSKGFDDVTDNIHPLFAMLKDKGMVDYDGSGKFLQRTQRNKQHSLEGYADYEVMDFTRQDLFENAKLPWRALNMTGAISEKEAAENDGEEARVKYFANKLEIMKEDAEDQIGAVFYLDGNLTANNKKPHGIMSFMNYTQGSQNTTDAFATVPTDSYAELSTALGNYGGTGTNSGKTFKATDPEWNGFTPIIVNAIFDPGSDARTWATHAPELIGRAELHANHSGKERDAVDLFTMTRTNMLDLRESQRSKERLVVNRGEKNTRLIALGFRGVINVDGVDCVIDSDVPATDPAGQTVHAVGWNFNRVKLCVLKREKNAKSQKKLKFWNRSGLFWDGNQAVYKYYLRCYLQLMFQPRYFSLITQCG